MELHRLRHRILCRKLHWKDTYPEVNIFQLEVGKREKWLFALGQPFAVSTYRRVFYRYEDLSITVEPPVYCVRTIFIVIFVTKRSTPRMMFYI